MYLGSVMGFPDGTNGGKNKQTNKHCRCRRHKRCWFNPSVGKIPYKRCGNLHHYSCLENPMGRGAWWATVHRGHKELDMTEAT